MSPEAFLAWAQRLHLTPEVQQRIATIRASPPARKVGGRASNVSGRYPSPKMGVTIQFESHHVELWAIYSMEQDADVLEYYDQPERIPLRYRTRSGRNTTQWHTPDFFVLRQETAGYEEWKPASALDDLTFTMPYRYQHAGSQGWECPPGQAFAASLGLTYHVRTSAQFAARFIENLQFLQDYWAHPVAIDSEQERDLLARITAHPGITLAEIGAAHPTVPLDTIWALLATRRLFTDLTTTPLMQHEQVHLYVEAGAVLPHTLPILGAPASRPAPAVMWQGRLWLSERVAETVTLRPEMGEDFTLSFSRFETLLATGAIHLMTAADPTPTTPEIRQALNRASPKAQREANRRLTQILAYLAGEEVQTPMRTVQRWYAAYQSAEAQFGSGYLGLLDRAAARGNRTPRAAESAMRLLEEVLQTHYAAPQAKRAASIYPLYRRTCEQHQIAPVTERTFYRVRARFATPDVTALRQGSRAAYAHQPFFWTLEATTPRHGDRPFALAHLDHTELDVELVSSVTGKPLGRPWATLLIDAYSRRILALTVSYDPPSYRAAMLLFRRCVQHHQRLPQAIVVDRGTDFGSVYFETLLARYFITKKERPAHQPHFGSLVERIFGTATTMFLNQLLGNTQASKTARQMTRAVDPQRLAVWTLERFTARLEEWAYDIYDQLDHPALGQSPAEAFAQGMQFAGARTHRLIPYTDEFLMLTRPTTRTGQVRIDAARGISVNGIRYWNPVFRAPSVGGTSVPVRYEPFDMGVAFAFVEGQWVECTADNFAQVHGRSEHEWQLILDEWRQQQRAHGQRRVQISAQVLAPFLEAVAAEEQVLLQRQRDLEGQTLRDALLGTTARAYIPPHPVVQEPDLPLDLAAIPRYEEYD